MEHVIASNIMSHLEENYIISPVQHGFHCNHSCYTRLVGLLYDLTSSYDHGTQSDLIQPKLLTLFYISNYCTILVGMVFVTKPPMNAVRRLLWRTPVLIKFLLFLEYHKEQFLDPSYFQSLLMTFLTLLNTALCFCSLLIAFLINK